MVGPFRTENLSDIEDKKVFCGFHLVTNTITEHIKGDRMAQCLCGFVIKVAEKKRNKNLELC